LEQNQPKKKYHVNYKKDARKFIKSNKIFGLKFYRAFSLLAENRYANWHKFDIIKFQMSKDDVWRMRIGKYRAIFYFDNDNIVIEVIRIDSIGIQPRLY